jgi:HD superfamily phosphohydrolase
MSKIRIVKDCIYGHIEIPPLCQLFIDVPEFQRLRRVKQLGLVQYTYPSAVHTRFEHSLGVMHLAGKMVEQLRTFVVIDQRTQHLIQLAALYHDAGHMSFSHLFDTVLKSFPFEDYPSTDNTIFFSMLDHESRSVYFISQVNDRLKLLTREELKFVQNTILGEMPKDEKNPYLYQIVSNKQCGIDVDKMDYLRRDAYHTGFAAFQSDYIILNAMVDEKNNIAFREKSKMDIIDLFHTRTKMHTNVYQHHTSKQLDKIHFCMLKRLGYKLFMYGKKTDDSNIETLIRNSESLKDLIECIDTRNLEHDCEICKEFISKTHIIPSGSINMVTFI